MVGEVPDDDDEDGPAVNTTSRLVRSRLRRVVHDNLEEVPASRM
jgi:hypothetical protein